MTKSLSLCTREETEGKRGLRTVLPRDKVSTCLFLFMIEKQGFARALEGRG